MAERNEILMPKLGLTMTEGLMAEWYVTSGDFLKAGDLMFVVETDKVATDIMAPSDGQLIEILVAKGETVPVGSVVARWTGEGQPVGDDLPSPTQFELENKKMVLDLPIEAPETKVVLEVKRLIATPLARNLANEAALDLHTVIGTGPRGRIKAQDVRSSLQAAAQAVMNKLAPTQEVSPTRIPLTGQMQAMARRMVQAKQDVPHFYLSSEAEVSELMSLRERLNSSESASKLTVNHFLIAAVAHALNRCPWQNRIWFDNGILDIGTLDVGVAVSTEKGLMAPVLHGLEGTSLDNIAVRANGLIERVRNGQAKHEDLSGGAITLSNAGMFNVTYMAPIINPPQSAILGVGSVRQLFRPDLNGNPELRREMGLVLACDHRIHDGTSGLKFLNTIIDLLQNPYQLLRSIT